MLAFLYVHMRVIKGFMTTKEMADFVCCRETLAYNGVSSVHADRSDALGCLLQAIGSFLRTPHPRCPLACQLLETLNSAVGGPTLVIRLRVPTPVDNRGGNFVSSEVCQWLSKNFGQLREQLDVDPGSASFDVRDRGVGTLRRKKSTEISLRQFALLSRRANPTSDILGCNHREFLCFSRLGERVACNVDSYASLNLR